MPEMKAHSSKWRDHPKNTYLLTPWCRVLLQKLTGLPLVKKFPTFYGTWTFITALTSVRHLSLSWASPIQSTYPHPTSWRSIPILSTHLRLGLPSGLFPSGFPTKTLYTPSPHPHAPHVQPISEASIKIKICWNLGPNSFIKTPQVCQLYFLLPALDGLHFRNIVLTSTIHFITTSYSWNYVFLLFELLPYIKQFSLSSCTF